MPPKEHCLLVFYTFIEIQLEEVFVSVHSIDDYTNKNTYWYRFLKIGIWTILMNIIYYN